MHNRISQILVSLVLIVLALQIGINAAKTIAKTADVKQALK